MGDDGVDADDVVGEASEQVLAVGRPGQRGARNSLLAISASDLDLINHGLGFQVPDLDGLVGGSDQPVLDRGEDQGVDDVLSIQGVQELALGQVPEKGLVVFSTGGAERAIRGDSDGVQVTGVATGYAAGWTAPSATDNVANMVIAPDTGEITITYTARAGNGTLTLVPYTGGAAAPAALPDATAAFTPPNDGISWRCRAAGSAFAVGNAGTLEAKFAPAECR